MRLASEYTLDAVLHALEKMQYYLGEIPGGGAISYAYYDKETGWRWRENKLAAVCETVAEIEGKITREICTILQPNFDAERKLKTGSITPETYEEIKCRWEERWCKRIRLADATTLEIDGYKNRIDDLFRLVAVCKYWESIKNNMRRLADSAERIMGSSSHETRWFYTKHLRRLIIDIKEGVDLGLNGGHYNINGNEQAWLEKVQTWRTNFEPAAAALINIRVEENRAELRYKIAELRGLVAQIEIAQKHTPLVKGVSQTPTQGGGGGGGGGGGTGEGEGEGVAEAHETTAAVRTSAGVGEGSGASLFSQPNSDKDEAEKSDHDLTKGSVPKSGSKP